MAAGLIVPVSGPYIGLWNALALGTLSDDGYDLSCTVQGQEVNLSDAWGMTLVESIYRGQNWRIRIRGLEWDKLGQLAILQMFGRTGAANGRNLSPSLSYIGDRWTRYCQTLLLTSILGDPPAFPQTLTAINAGWAPNTTTNGQWTSKVREMPHELVLLPYVASGSGASTVAVPFSTT